MRSQPFYTLLWLFSSLPFVSSNLDLDSDFHVNTWVFRDTIRKEDQDDICMKIHPSAGDMARRLYAILPYMDKDHANTAFLHKFRGTVFGMSDGEDVLDREAAYYAAVLIPLIFLQQYKDTWCLLERFHRALRLYQISHPTEKRLALKILQNLRAVSIKIQSFIFSQLEQKPATRTAYPYDEKDSSDRRDVKFIKELIKNLG